MSKTRQKYTIDREGAPASRPLDGRYQILALSGGGYRGLFTAELLVRLESEGGPLKERFDLITGTSIGSILAGALSVGVPASDCLQGMLDHGESIFPTKGRIGRFARSAKQHFIGAPYKTEPLARAIDEILKEKASAKLSAIDQALAIPCVSYTRAALKVLRSKGLAGRDASDVKMSEAMLASAAAPTYFPSRKLVNEIVVDGGLVANAPEMIGVSDAVNLQGVQLSDICVLSIGTASASLARPAEDAKASSSADWMMARQLFQVAMGAQEHMAKSQCQMLLDNRYLRLDANPSPDQAEVLKLDRADKTATGTLSDLARECWDERPISVIRQVDEILRHNS